MTKSIKISTAADQLQEGLFGQVFLWVFEILPYLDRQDIRPHWAIRSALYGRPADFLVIPGLLELNYEPAPGPVREVNLEAMQEGYKSTLGNDWDYVSALWHKFFRVPERIIRQADGFPALAGALGLHYRGTDKNKAAIETNYVSEDDFLVLIRDFVTTHPAIDLIFIATDESGFVERVQAQHPAIRIVNSGKVTHHKHLDREDNFAKGEHAVLDCLLLSRCKYLLKCQSALSAFAKVLNPRVEAYRLSANKLVYWNMGAPYFPDGQLPQYTSRNPECQQILARLFAGDWTQNIVAARKYGRPFQFQKRKGYMRRAKAANHWSFPLWSWDGLCSRMDMKIDDLRNRMGI
ncbi:MAG TPA: hypothetical protein VG347_21315 [Verrucomicrobiae bacterium]|nr:hypothetical protein [Verrucomicrobiae bacterium]